MSSGLIRRFVAVTVTAWVALFPQTAAAWGPQGHRLVALVAAERLSPAARRQVERLLPDAGLADVAVWADDMVADNAQTAPWHYVNLPVDATGYDRDRDCPRQPNVRAGSRNDRWRDCIVDRIEYHRQRVADASLDRADRATALKYLVHFVGDLHQPFHAVGVARGGNEIPVVAFGSPDCPRPDGSSAPCNLHGLWDSLLIRHRGLSDRQYLSDLTAKIRSERWDRVEQGTPESWALESFALAQDGLLPARGAADEAYYRRHIPVVDRRLALGGIRLARLLNEALR